VVVVGRSQSSVVNTTSNFDDGGFMFIVHVRQSCPVSTWYMIFKKISPNME